MVVKHLPTVLNSHIHLNQLKRAKNRTIIGYIIIVTRIIPMVVKGEKLPKPLLLLKEEKKHQGLLRKNKAKGEVLSQVRMMLLEKEVMMKTVILTKSRRGIDLVKRNQSPPKLRELPRTEVQQGLVTHRAK